MSTLYCDLCLDCGLYLCFKGYTIVSETLKSLKHDITDVSISCQ